MSTKRIKLERLPSADEAMLGAAGQVAAPKDEKQKSTKAPIAKGAKATTMPKEGPREHVSTYLSPSLLKRIEEVRAHLFVERNHKLTKSELIERALRLGLRDPDAILKQG